MPYGNSVQFGGMVDIRSLRHQRWSWAQPLARADSSSCHLESWVCGQQLNDSSGNTVVFLRFSLEYTAVLLGRLALLAGRLFRSILSCFWFEVLRQNHARVATSDLNEFFKFCQNFVGQWMPFQQFSQKNMKMKQSAVLSRRILVENVPDSYSGYFFTRVRSTFLFIC